MVAQEDPSFLLVLPILERSGHICGPMMFFPVSNSFSVHQFWLVNIYTSCWSKNFLLFGVPFFHACISPMSKRMVEISAVMVACEGDPTAWNTYLEKHIGWNRLNHCQLVVGWLRRKNIIILVAHIKTVAHWQWWARFVSSKRLVN